MSERIDAPATSVKERNCAFSIIKGVGLGATLGAGTSIAAIATAYCTGYKYHHSYREALHDGAFDMAFDTLAGGVFGGALQYWQARQWNKAFVQHTTSCNGKQL